MKQNNKQKDLAEKVKQFIKEDNPLEVNRYYCYYRSNLQELGSKINFKLFNEVNTAYLKYFNEKYLKGQKIISLW